MKNNIKILNELQIELQNTFGINKGFAQQKLVEILLRCASKLNDNPVPSLDNFSNEELNILCRFCYLT